MAELTNGDAFAAIAAPDAGLGLMVPVVDEVLAAGRGLIEMARARAADSRTPAADATDILAGNAYLALSAETPDRAAVAACLGAIGHITGRRAVVVTVRRDGNELDCRWETVPTTEGATPEKAVRRRLAAILGVPPARPRPYVLMGHDDDTE